MAIRMTGMVSGLDTDSIVKELVSAYSTKKEKYKKEQTKLGWKQEIWKDLNKEVNTFYKSVGNLRFEGGYSTKKTTSSDTAKATVSAGSNAVTGTQKLHVLSTAQSGYLTGGKITASDSSAKVTSSTKLSELGFTEDETALKFIAKDKDGKDISADIKLSKDSTISDAVKALRDVGLNASFDENNGRIFLSSSDTDSIVKELVSAYSTKKEKYEKEQTKLGWKQEIWKSLNKEVNSFYKSAGNLRFDSGYNTKKTTSSDSTKATVSASGNATVGTQKLHVLSTAQSGYLTGAEIKTTANEKVTTSTKLSDLGVTADEITFNVGPANNSASGTTKQIKVGKDSTISDVVNQLKDAGLNANFDAGNGRFYLSSSDSGYATDFNITADSSDTNSTTLLNALGLGNTAKKLDGSDAVIVLNGVKYTSTTNNFSINGLSISVNGVTDKVDDLENVDVDALDDSKAVSISTTTDTQGIYDKIKDFLTSYNNIINKMTKLYNADSAKNYEPLTDDEKSQMSDSEVEKWETKIKDSLLRRDSNLSTIMNAMTTSMTKAISINGKNYSLSSFGISTLGYMNSAENEQNAYHIDGDEDDENTSGNKDKLMAALSSDPDTVIDFMKQLSTNLYTAIDKQMQSNSLRSRYSIYNDKEMTSQYTSYTKTIAEWETKISDKEDYYYKKFSKMETALSKLNSQTSSLSGMFSS